MKRSWTTILTSRRPLTQRERVMLLCLLGMVVIYGAGLLAEGLYRGPQRELTAAVADAEEQVRHNARLLSREEQIHARFARLESPREASGDSVLTETEVLRELSELAGGRVRVKSVVPRMGHESGVPIMLVALDFEGPFDAVVGYVEQILDGMPSEIGNLSLSPSQGADGGVVCRMSIRVGGFETTTES